MKKEDIVGNRYQVREDMIGLTRAEKKRIWNQEAWARQRNDKPVSGGGSEAAKRAVTENARYKRMICPPGIIGVCPDKIWYKTNDASFRRGLQVALLKFKSNAG